jgi:hypothetical protein
MNRRPLLCQGQRLESLRPGTMRWSARLCAESLLPWRRYRAKLRNLKRTPQKAKSPYPPVLQDALQCRQSSYRTTFVEDRELSLDRFIHMVPSGLFFLRRLEAVNATGVILIKSSDQSVPCCLFFSGPSFAFFCHVSWLPPVWVIEQILTPRFRRTLIPWSTNGKEGY